MSDYYIYGIHAVAALLANQYRKTKVVYVIENRIDKRMQELLMLAENKHIPIIRLTSQIMNQRFANSCHQGIVASAETLPDYVDCNLPQLLKETKNPALILILDGITDPHNLGACLRSADATGTDFVIIPKDKNASITPIVSKVACGAAESLPVVRVTNLARTMMLLKEQGIWIYGAASEVEYSIYGIDFKKTSVAIVMGSEGRGIRRLTRDLCDGLFSLPMLGKVSSLNVSVATGACLYEILRQRNQ